MKQFIFRKEVDKSTLTDKITIPKKVEEVLINNLSSILEKGGSLPIELKIDQNKFHAKIIYPNIKDGRNVTQIYYGKEVIECLKEEFRLSYDFLINKKENVPEELKEYIDFYQGDKKDKFIVEVIRYSHEVETKFKKWMITDKKGTGIKTLAESTANKYIRRLHKIDSYLGTYTYRLSDKNDVLKIIDMFKSSKELVELNKIQHREPSSALISYKNWR